MIDYLHNRVIRRRVRRSAREFMVRAASAPTFNGSDNKSALAMLWTGELPVMLFDISFFGKGTPRWFSPSLGRVRVSESRRVFEGFSIACNALLLAASRTHPQVRRPSVEKFVNAIQHVYVEPDMPDAFLLEKALATTPPNEWFTATLWLSVLGRTHANEFFFTRLRTSGPLGAFDIALLESQLLHLWTRVLKEVIIDGKLLDEFDSA